MVFDYVAGKQDWLSNALPIEGKLAHTATIGGLADRNVPTCHLTEKLSEVRDRLHGDAWKICVVINDTRSVLGLLRNEVVENSNQFVDRFMASGPATFRPHVTVEQIADYIREKKLDTILVTTSDGRLIGALDEADLGTR